jgi:nucleoside-diphosphate-sugar epimerase
MIDNTTTEGTTSMILVTGATGMTGQFIIQELQQRNIPARALVRAASAEKAALLDAEIVVGDLNDFASLHQAMNGVKGVIHAACTFTDMPVDVAAMGALLNAWQEGPFIFISSLDVYGLPQVTPMTESHPVSETYGDYGRGKVLCERLLTAAAKATGRTDYALLRAPHIWGPHPKPRHRLVNPEIAAGKPVVLPGNSEEEWSEYRDAWIDVRDLARLTVDLLTNPPGVALNVLSGHFLWHELYAQVIALIGSSSEIIHRPMTEMSDEEQQAKRHLAQTWRFDDTRLRHECDYVPRYSLDQTLQDALI